ncbi:MAG TPA: TetR/AcrR family transcriptional regulator [Ktedonobacterales bacterium]|nr:TetR/AcrR family transcriptional regulator [Ktedonobacterales bacterium]
MMITGRTGPVKFRETPLSNLWPMTREYELKRRAEQMADTRRRIVEAAIELHQELGPARTSVSAIADRAGVQRQTYYRHFPDLRSLQLACSGLHLERNPPPDPRAWRAITDPYQRLRTGLGELYAYYAANEPMLANVIRDAETDPVTREIAELRMAALAELREALAEGLQHNGSSPRLVAALGLATDFHTWRLLVRRHGLPPSEAAELVVSIIRCLN